MLHDPAVYPDPDVFNPERHISALGREPQYDPRRICFGFGRRICPGRDAAEETLFSTAATVLATLHIAKALDEQGNVITPELALQHGIVRFSHFPIFDYQVTDSLNLAGLSRSDVALRPGLGDDCWISRL